MFYSETLLQKTGPLARVWLSANLERKLSKHHVLQSNIEDSVEAIITPNQAPFALRLSGQLLLGVARIYSRKTRYLLDDCNEALLKIKMAFRANGNNDMPANSHIPNREALMLPDQITPLDMDLLPPPDATWLLSQIDEVTATPAKKTRANNRDINLQEDFNNSQFLQDNTQDDEMAMAPIDIELDLDYGMDDLPGIEESVEIGRDAGMARPVDDDMLSELELHPSVEKDAPGQDPSVNPDIVDDGIRIIDDEGDIRMGDDDDLNFNPGDQTTVAEFPAIPDMGRRRISESPLSDIDPDFARQVEEEYSRHNNTNMYEPEEEDQPIVRKPAQKAKKQRILQPDEQTMLTSGQIKAQQNERENILKPQSFLPRDPYVLSLMGMQKNGSFIFNIMREDRNSSWAPELRGLLSLEAISRRPELKRKRDSGVADLDSEQEQGASKSPRLEIGEDTELTIRPDHANFGDSSILNPDQTAMEIPADEGIMFNADDDERDQARENNDSYMPAFDETVAPIVHPADSGPVSLGTKHAVHILRDLFGEEAADDDEKRRNTSVVFQDLLPEGRTTKADATKMFFECLVLATKDAIKVEQPEGSLGGPLRVRGKRGLWGEWAEREAGGEIAQNQEDQDQNQPEPAVASAPAVAVEA